MTSAPDTQNQLDKLEAKFDHLMTMMDKSKGKEIYSLEGHVVDIVVSLSVSTCIYVTLFEFDDSWILMYICKQVGFVKYLWYFL